MKTIVITGASTGIGLATVKEAIAAGYQVIATARTEQDLQKLATLKAEPVKLELTSQQSIATAAALIKEKTQGTIDVLFNNAGYGLQVAMEDTNWQALEKQHTTNVIGPIELTNLLLPCLQQGSHLIFNSSILGLITVAFRGPYCMSKYALEAAADAYRLELEPLGINVHLLEPGPIEADFRPRAFKETMQVLGGKKTRLDYSNHLDRLKAKENTPGTLPAKACADIIMAIAKGEKNKARYPVTKVAKQAAFFKRLLGSGFDKLAKKAEPVKEH